MCLSAFACSTQKRIKMVVSISWSSISSLMHTVSFTRAKGISTMRDTYCDSGFARIFPVLQQQRLHHLLLGYNLQERQNAGLKPSLEKRSTRGMSHHQQRSLSVSSSDSQRWSILSPTSQTQRACVCKFFHLHFKKTNSKEWKFSFECNIWVPVQECTPFRQESRRLESQYCECHGCRRLQTAASAPPQSSNPDRKPSRKLDASCSWSLLSCPAERKHTLRRLQTFQIPLFSSIKRFPPLVHSGNSRKAVCSAHFSERSL